MAVPKQNEAISEESRISSLHGFGDAVAANTAAIGRAKKATHMTETHAPKKHKASSGWAPPSVLLTKQRPSWWRRGRRLERRWRRGKRTRRAAPHLAIVMAAAAATAHAIRELGCGAQPLAAPLAVCLGLLVRGCCAVDVCRVRGQSTEPWAELQMESKQVSAAASRHRIAAVPGPSTRSSLSNRHSLQAAAVDASTKHRSRPAATGRSTVARGRARVTRACSGHLRACSGHPPIGADTTTERDGHPGPAEPRDQPVRR